MNFRRLPMAFKALRQLGIQPLALYGRYQLGLWTGYYRRKTADAQPWNSEYRPLPANPLFPLPCREAVIDTLGDSAASLLAEADEIVAGKARFFGTVMAPLSLKVPGPLKHWTTYEKGLEHTGREKTGGMLPGAGDWMPMEAARDIKFLWEPGRFGWAFILGRAYFLSRDERYAQAFWNHTEAFLDANPPNQGPYWTSAQEVALRLIALVFAAQVFADSACTTAQRIARLAQAVADHASRIPPTLAYARSQNNNHLLTEAAGLYTAGIFLPGHPDSIYWRKLGWRWLHTGLASQIAPDGAYIQNSANYHRLMLQTALWVYQIALAQGQPFPRNSMQRLGAASRWLLAMVDRQTGQTPNLGPNDGAYIFPFTVCPVSDYRPVLQAAGQAFLGERPFPPGLWDEMALWLGNPGEDESEPQVETKKNAHSKPTSFEDAQYMTPHILRSLSGCSWAYFRIARHRSRPGHADQLHLDLWWRGLNVAQDAGTYLYNGTPPWENALDGSFVHNTVTVAGQEQMQRAGRFLWLEWAQGQVVSGELNGEGVWKRLAARHDGYRHLGIYHQRQVCVLAGERWVVVDTVDELLQHNKIARRKSKTTFRLHWLLPDWPWDDHQATDLSAEIRIQTP